MTDWAQWLRLFSGLVLFVFVLPHLLNHAFGLISLQLISDFQQARLLVTRSSLGTVILSLALVVHIVLGLAVVCRRISSYVAGWQRAQMLSGIAIPFLLIPHVVDMVRLT